MALPQPKKVNSTDFYPSKVPEEAETASAGTNESSQDHKDQGGADLLVNSTYIAQNLHKILKPSDSRSEVSLLDNCHL